jgi:hypothetical protein
MVERFEHLAEFDAILEGDVEQQLPNDVREVLLDVILAWADLDMTTAFFVSLILGMTPDEGADKFGRKFIEEKLKKASKALNEQGKQKVASEICAIAQVYPKKAFLRKRIAHTRCAGVRRSDPNRIIFLPFEREGPAGNLAVEVLHISTFTDAIKWAKDTSKYLMEYVDKENFFEQK